MPSHFSLHISLLFFLFYVKYAKPSNVAYSYGKIFLVFVLEENAV